ncbi:MAG: hypothetical protein AB7T59_03245 [Hyphomonadaceae bacterium]
MTDAEPPPPSPRTELPRVKGRLPFDPEPFGKGVRQGASYLYAAVAAILVAVAVYMGAVVGHPLFSGYVLAPSIGALWFGLRLFMLLGKR